MIQLNSRQYCRYTANIYTYYYKYSITPRSFSPGLKPSFSANPSHHSPSFSSSGLTTWIPRGLFTDTSEHIRFLLFSFSVFPLFSCWFRAADQLMSAVDCTLIQHLVSYHVSINWRNSQEVMKQWLSALSRRPITCVRRTSRKHSVLYTCNDARQLAEHTGPPTMHTSLQCAQHLSVGHLSNGHKLYTTDCTHL